MNGNQQKTGILFSLPVCIIVTFFVFPLGIILIFMRLYKKGKITAKIKNIGVGVGGVFVALFVIGLFTSPEADDPGQASKPNTSLSDDISSDSEKNMPSETFENSSFPTPEETTDPSADSLTNSITNPSSTATPPEAHSTLPDQILAESAYVFLLSTVRSDIDMCLADDPQDMTELRNNYEFLLSLYVNEYIYKTYAYGYFTGIYETEPFDYLLKNVNSVCTEMKEYFDEAEVDDCSIYCVKMAARSYDRYDFSLDLIGDEASPDVEAMWNAHIASALGIDTEIEIGG